MHGPGYGGTRGKGRKLRERGRAERAFQAMLIDDWRQPNRQRKPRQPIRIGRRREFLPGVEDVRIGSSRYLDVQLDLPLRNGVEDSSGGNRRVVWPPEEAGPVGASTLASPIGPLWREAIRFQPAGDGTAPVGEGSGLSVLARMRELRKRRRGSSFSLRRFAYGCLLGSAAAAGVLLVVDLLVR